MISNMRVFYSSCPLQGEHETNQSWGTGRLGGFQGKAAFFYQVLLSVTEVIAQRRKMSISDLSFTKLREQKLDI